MTVDDLLERLAELAQRTAETPLFNPVFQLSLDLSRQLESGDISLDDIESMLAELECQSLKSRATRFRRNHAPVSPEANDAALAETASTDDFEAFRAQWENPGMHAVFTAHPTFLLTPEQTEAFAKSASSDAEISDDTCVASAERPNISLSYEHGRAMSAIAHVAGPRGLLHM